MADSEDEILNFDIVIATKSYTPYISELISRFNYRYDMINWCKNTSYNEDIVVQLPFTEHFNGATTIWKELDKAIKATLRISELTEAHKYSYDKEELNSLINDFATLYIVWNFVKGDISIRWLYVDLYKFMHRLAVVSEFAHQCKLEWNNYVEDRDRENIMLMEQIGYVLDQDPNNRMLAFMTVLFEADISAWDDYLEHQHKHRS